MMFAEKAVGVMEEISSAPDIDQDIGGSKLPLRARVADALAYHAGFDSIDWTLDMSFQRQFLKEADGLIEEIWAEKPE